MINITPKTWYSVSAHLDSVGWTPQLPGTNGVPSVMDAWSGGAFDSLRDRLIVWGGGHTNYSGNEIYAFSLSAFTWSVIRNPVSAANVDAGSPGQWESTGYYPNASNTAVDTQQPRSRHTYNTLDYSSSIDRFIAFGCYSGFYQGGQTGNRYLLKYDATTNLWSSGTQVPTSQHYQQPLAYDSVTDKFWLYGGGSQGFLAEYNPNTDTWISHGDRYSGGQISNGAAYLTGVIDPVKRRLYGFGGGIAIYWNISLSGTIAATDISNSVSGNLSIVNAQAPGLAWDPISQCIVGWSGGSSVYTFNSTSAIWTQVTLDPSNTVTPTAANAQGTYGRFRYSPTSNVYVGVNATNENVFLFKLNADTGTSGTSGTNVSVGVNTLSGNYTINRFDLNWDNRKHKVIRM